MTSPWRLRIYSEDVHLLQGEGILKENDKNIHQQRINLPYFFILRSTFLIGNFSLAKPYSAAKGKAVRAK